MGNKRHMLLLSSRPAIENLHRSAQLEMSDVDSSDLDLEVSAIGEVYIQSPTTCCCTHAHDILGL